MNPQENLGTVNSEKAPTPIDTIEPMFDSGKEYNGMYESEADFKEAEALYKTTNIDVTGMGVNNYEIVTTDATSPTLNEGDYAVTEVMSTEIPKTETDPTSTEMVAGTTPNDENVIDVEMREVTIDSESLDETGDLSPIIDKNEHITLGREKLNLTPRLKNLTKGIFGSIDQMLASYTTEDIPEDIDWQTFVMSEPDYDEDYDYELYNKLLNTQYRRRRAAKLSELYLRNIQEGRLQTPNMPTNEKAAVVNESEKTPTLTPLIEVTDTVPIPRTETLAIEHDPQTTEVSALENAPSPLAIGYEPSTPTEAEAPNQTGQPAISNQT